MKQIDGAVQAVACAIGFWRPSWILLKKLENAKKKFTRQIPQGQYAYCKYLEKIRVEFLSESRNKRRRRADSAKSISLHHHIVGGDLNSHVDSLIKSR